MKESDPAPEGRNGVEPPAGGMAVAAVAGVLSGLLDEARRTRQRRLLVLRGDRQRALATMAPCLGEAGLLPCALVAEVEPEVRPPPGLVLVPPETARRRLLGATEAALVVDLHTNPDPDVLGAVVGVVGGGGVLVLLVPPVDRWWEEARLYRHSLAPPPFTPEEVGGRLLHRLARSLEAAAGTAILDLDAPEGQLLVRPARPVAPAAAPSGPRPRLRPPLHPVEVEVRAACLTPDQERAVVALLDLARRNEPAAVVIESDRGRGKSAALGLAARAILGWPPGEGERPVEIVVTTAYPSGAAPALALAGAPVSRPLAQLQGREGGVAAEWGCTLVGPGGRMRLLPPAEAAAAAPDLLLVDEAATVGVDVLRTLLRNCPRVAFATTTHGYEGTGMGFTVRFLATLRASARPVAEIHLDTPVRWAPGDPVEAWTFSALLLDASPAPGEDVAEATPGEADYVVADAGTLVADEALLRQTFGLLVLAHYRTRPSDLALLLDGPAIRVRLLTFAGRVVAAALLDVEGGIGLEEARRAYFAAGVRLRGNLLPETLLSHLRMPPEVAQLRALRVVRIAVHPAVRGRGLGGLLLARVRDEAAALGFDYLGASFGATPELLRFWRGAGYQVVRLGTRAGAGSGERSAVMLCPMTPAGRALTTEARRRFARILPSQLLDPLRDLPAETVLAAALGAAPERPTGPMDFQDWEWEGLVALCAGAQTHDALVRPVQILVATHLLDPSPPGPTPLLSPEEERLLVARVLQGRRWREVADALTAGSVPDAMRMLRGALRPLLLAYGGPEVAERLRRFEAARNSLKSDEAFAFLTHRHSNKN